MRMLLWPSGPSRSEASATAYAAAPELRCLSFGNSLADVALLLIRLPENGPMAGEGMGMTEPLEEQRRFVLDAIDRQREESRVAVPSRAELAGATPRAVRRCASSLRAQAWSDRTESAEDAGEGFDDPGWAPSATLRIAALADHLSELSAPTGAELRVAAREPPPAATAPEPADGPWAQISLCELEERLGRMVVQGTDITLFDVARRECLARANSWRGEIVDIVDVAGIEERIDAQRQILRGNGANEEKQSAKAEIVRLEKKRRAWAEACVRAGFARAHLGAELTADFFRRYVTGAGRLDVTVDVNAMVYGLVHHIARLAPRVDFARSAITDLEIQRLADSDKETWRKACRPMARLPGKGPAWRALGSLDTTSLLVARADQNGKAPGADALLAHNFEETLLRAQGVRCVLLTADNGLARTVAARLPPGAVWVGYVDPMGTDERFVSPLLSWPKTPSVSETRYASLAELLDEMLVCGLSEHVAISDGKFTVELRAHLEGEHQYVADWQQGRLFVRGLPASDVGDTTAPGVQRVTPSRDSSSLRAWPLRDLRLPEAPRVSGARVTIEQVATALEWVKASPMDPLDRHQLPLKGEAQRDAWNVLGAIGMVDAVGRPIGRAALLSAVAENDSDAIRAMLLRFMPVARIGAAVQAKARTIAEAKERAGLGDKTFRMALNLAIACGAIWRNGIAVGPGIGFWKKTEFREWLVAVLAQPIRMSVLAQRACEELELSPVRFREALRAVIDESTFLGSRGGSSEAHGLDARVLVLDDEGRIRVQKLSVDDLLGLRSLGVRP